MIPFVKLNPAGKGCESDTPLLLGNGSPFVLAHLSIAWLNGLTSSGPFRCACYNLYRFERKEGAWALVVTVRAYSQVDKRFVNAQEKELFLSDRTA